MRCVCVSGKPGYVHGLGLQDALCKARDPGASEHTILLHRWNIDIASAAPDENIMTVHVSGPANVELASRLWNSATGTIRCFAPPGVSPPEVHIRFLSR